MRKFSLNKEPFTPYNNTFIQLLALSPLPKNMLKPLSTLEF